MIDSIRKELENAILDLRSLVVEHKDKIPLHSVRRWSISGADADGERSLGYLDFIEPDYGKFLYPQLDELFPRKAQMSLAAAVRNSPAVQRALRLHSATDPALEHDLLAYYVIPLSERLLEQERTAGAHSADALAASLRKFDEAISRNHYNVRLTAPLLNFRMNADEIPLVDGLRITRITDTDLASYGDLVGIIGSQMGSLLTMRKLHFQVEASLEMERVQPRHLGGMGNFQDAVRNIETALRLLEKGAVGLLFEHSKATDIFGEPEAGGSTVFSSELRIPGTPYEFGTSDAPQLLDIYSRLSSLKELRAEARFALALGRFLDSYRKPLIGDRIIDHWIGLEALFAPDGKSGEVTFKASLRLAHFIADRAHRGDVFKTATKSYGLRSDLAHGTKSSASAEEIATSEDLLRRALVECLNRQIVPSKEFLSQLVLGTA